MLKASDQRGMTLIETLVVIALIALVAGLSAANSFDAFRRNGYRNERDTLILALHAARSQAMSAMCFGTLCTSGKAHGVFIQTDPVTHLVKEYIIFQGESYTTRDAAVDQVINSNYGVLISGMSEVIFTQLSGDPTRSSVGSIMISDPNGAHQGSLASVITTNAEGQITWTN